MTKPTVVLKRGELSLPTELTQDEFNVKARELAATHEAIALERETQKETRTELKRRMEELEQKRSHLARIVRDRREDRLVEVEEHANYARGVVEFVRLDTGEVYGTRPLTGDDRQLKLLGADSAKKETKGQPAESTKH